MVKTLGRAPDEIARLDGAAARLQDARIGVGRIRGTFEPMIDAIPNLGIIVLLLIGSWQVSTGRLDTGQVVQAAALFSLLAFPMRVFGFFLQELPRGVVASARLSGVVANDREAVGSAGRRTDAPRRVRSRSSSATSATATATTRPSSTTSTSTCPPARSSPSSGPPARASRRCASCCRGSSTRTRGSVHLGGVDLRDLDPDDVRASVALVFQETFLFADSVRENVTLGEAVDDEALGVGRLDRPRRRISSAACPRAGTPSSGSAASPCRAVSASDSPSTRALLRRPRVLVLDDATSAVDPVIEAAILADLSGALATSTLVVAHRISTIELADRVAFLEDGRIVAEGSHQDLLATVPAYGRLVRAYAEAVER